MRNISWNTTEAYYDGDGSKQLPAGAYVARITGAKDYEDKEYVELIFDIAEGEYKDYYNDDFGNKNPWAHHIIMSYKSDNSIKFLKGRLERINESNAGFDAFAAWDSGRLDMYVNRLIGIRLENEEYQKRDGSTGNRLTVTGIHTVEDVRSGKVKVKESNTSTTSTGSGSGTSQTSVNDVDVPF